MKFRLWTILWVFALFASGMATFGFFGIPIALLVISFWAVIFRILRMTLVEWFVVLAIILNLLVLLTPAVSASREGARVAACRGKLQVIVNALLTYQEKQGRLPPITGAEPNSIKPLLAHTVASYSG